MSYIALPRCDLQLIPVRNEKNIFSKAVILGILKTVITRPITISKWSVQNELNDIFVDFIIWAFVLSYWSFTCVLWLQILHFIACIYSFSLCIYMFFVHSPFLKFLVCLHFSFYFFPKERNREGCSWVGGKVGRIWEELNKGKPWSEYIIFKKYIF